MALITGSNILETVFTPAIGTFVIQATGGLAALERRSTVDSAWSKVQPILDGMSEDGSAFNCENPVSGVQYRFISLAGTTPVVRADQ
jgi:hypothetical protein